MNDYQALVDAVEATLYSQSTLSLDKLKERLADSKNLEGKTFTDDEYYWRVVYVVFYAGIKAYRVSDRIETVRKRLSNYHEVSEYSEEEIKDILKDRVIRQIWLHEKRIHASVNNARVFKSLVEAYGSFQNYVDSFAAHESFENLVLLKEDLEFRFDRFRDATALHFLTDSGLPVIKPDRVICRVFQRLGIIHNENQLLTAIIQGRKIAQATRLPVRYIDTIFVVLGQDKSPNLGIEDGVCSARAPKCHLCKARIYCSYYAKEQAGPNTA